MTRKTIEFAPASATPTLGGSLWAGSKKSSYKDLLLKPEYLQRKQKFPAGSTCFRLVPALAGSGNWMMGIHVLSHANGRHCHPRTINPGCKSVYDLAYGWLKEHQPGSLYSKANRDGYRLLADPHCLCWILVEEEGKPKARLVLASGYDGSRGGVSGLGHQLHSLITDSLNDGEDSVDPLAPEEGRLVGIDKTLPAGARYPTYRLRLGRHPAPIEDLFARMDPEETAALRPLEEVIHVPSEEEEWKLLETIVDPETVARIREDSV